MIKTLVKFKLAISIIIVLLGVVATVIIISWKSNIHLSANSKVFLTEIKRYVPIGTPGNVAFTLMQNTGFSCSVDDSTYGTSIICRKTEWFFPSFFGHTWVASFQLKQGKTYKIETDVYTGASMSSDEPNNYLILLLQLWIVYIVVAIPIVMGLLFLLRKWFDVPWSSVDMLLFIIPFWVYGLDLYLVPNSNYFKYLPTFNSEHFSQLRDSLFIYGTIFVLLVPLISLSFKTVEARAGKRKVSGWFILLFYCIIVTCLAIFSSLD